MSSASTKKRKVLDEIPLEPENISRDWLFEVINQYRRSMSINELRRPSDIEDCSIDECEHSHGYLSTTYKLVANFRCDHENGDDDQDMEEDSYEFFLKMLPGIEEKHLRLISETRVFQREVEANFSILPRMRQFVREKTSTGKSFSIVSPDIIYGSYNDEGSGILVEMDMNQEGFFPLSHSNGFNLPQLLVIVERLAEFHAIGTAMIDTDKDHSFQELFDQFNVDKKQDHFNTTFALALRDFARFLRRVPGYFSCFEKIDKIRTSVPDILSKLKETRHSKFPMKTVLHGELWEKNLLLRFDQMSSNLEIVFCDWKKVSLGSPELDLAFLMLSCTTKPMRKANTGVILETYWSRFVWSLNLFHIDFEDRFSKYGLYNFIEDFEAALPLAFFQSALIMTREMKYLELEFLNAKDNGDDLDKIGNDLRLMGRRILDLAEEFVPKMELVTLGISGNCPEQDQVIRNGNTMLKA